MNLTTLKNRSVSVDLIEMYKVVSVSEEIDLVNSPNMGSNLEMEWPATRVRENFLILRIEHFKSCSLRSIS